jgi:thymidylate kinase
MQIIMGKVIAIEGHDGAGKTTLANKLTSLPGVTSVGFLDGNPLARLRKDVDVPGIRPIDRFNYYLSGYIHNAQEAREKRLLHHVILDRSIYSTLAVNSALAGKDRRTRRLMRSLVPPILFREIDTLVYLVASPETRRQRMQNRTAGDKLTNVDEESLKRAEEMDREYRQLIRRRRRNPINWITGKRTIIIKTDNKNENDVYEEVTRKLKINPRRHTNN